MAAVMYSGETKPVINPDDPIAVKCTEQAEVSWHGIDFTVDLATCRKALVQHMLNEGKQLQQVAADAGVSRMSLWRFMTGKKPSIQTFHRITKAIGLDIRKVVNGVAPFAFGHLPFAAAIGASIWLGWHTWCLHEHTYWLHHYILNLPGHPVADALEDIFGALASN